jgi:hypothetical protein
MDRYHKPGPNAWECQQKGCERQFETELLFRQHHASDHRCRRSCMHADQSKTSVPLKLAFACGFEGCTGLFNNWDNWRDHVRDHLWSGASVSSCQYTVEFRNLLRRREISSLWNSRVEQQRRAPQGYQQGFLWEPSTSSHLKKHLEFSSLHCEREELVDYIFRAGVRAPPQREQRELQQQLAHSTNINLPLTSLSTTTDFSIPESNAVQSLTMSNLAGDSSFQAPAYDVSYNLDQFSFQFTTQQPQTSFDPMVNSGPGLASDFAQSPFPPSWSDDEAMNLHAPSTNNIPHELENQSGPQRDFWYPNVPNDPLAAYGLPPDATNPHVSSSKVETQHTRTKSSGTNSLAKKISGYFSSGRKSTHSRSDSDNSDQRMGGMQAYY